MPFTPLPPGVQTVAAPAAVSGFTPLPQGAQYDAVDPADQKYSPLETVGLNLTNLFGAGGVIHGAIGYARGKGYGATRDEYVKELEAANAQNPIAHYVGAGGALVGETLIGGGVGKLASLAAKGVGLGARLATIGEANPLISRVLAGGAGGAAYGAASGAGEAASHGQDILPAAASGAAVGGALGGALSGVAYGAGKLLRGAPAAEETNLLKGVAQGTGESGSATPTAKKMLLRDKAGIIDTLRSDPELLAATRKRAVDALPVVHNRLNEVGSQLDPLYDRIDKLTGGVSIHELSQYLDAKAAEYAKTPLNETYVKAVDDLKQSLQKAYAPEMAAQEASAKRLEAMGFTSHKPIEDAMVPTREIRSVVTRLQTRGSQIINPLNPGEAAQMKSDLAGVMKDFIDQHLDSVGGDPAVEQIRRINSTYTALKNISKAIEQRSWKEQTGSTSGTGLVGNLLRHGSMVAAVPLALSHPVAAAGELIAGHLVPKYAPRIAESATSALARLQMRATAGDAGALRALAAIRAGSSLGTTGASVAGGAVGGTLAQTQQQGAQ